MIHIRHIVFACIANISFLASGIEQPGFILDENNRYRPIKFAPSLPTAQSAKNARFWVQTGDEKKQIPLMPAVLLEKDPEVLPPLPYESLSIIGRKKIIDANGKIIWQVSEHQIYRVESSPSGKRFLADCGSGIFRIRSRESAQKMIQIPIIWQLNPHLETISPFYWVNDSLLVGIADISLTRQELGILMASDMEDTYPVRSFLFLYNCDTEQLTQLVVPDKIPAVFSLEEARGCYIKILSNPNSANPKTHWLEISNTERKKHETTP